MDGSVIENVNIATLHTELPASLSLLVDLSVSLIHMCACMRANFYFFL